MKRQNLVPANDNLESTERWKAKFPPPQTANGNPITNVSATWIGDEDFLYAGRSKEGFHAAIAKPDNEHTLAWGKAYPTAKEASDAACGHEETEQGPKLPSRSQ
jgi:hypothetical protein